MLTAGRCGSKPNTLPTKHAPSRMQGQGDIQKADCAETFSESQCIASLTLIRPLKLETNLFTLNFKGPSGISSNPSAALLWVLDIAYWTLSRTTKVHNHKLGLGQLTASS